MVYPQQLFACQITKTLTTIELAGVPLVGPSANTSGKPSPTTAAHVFHDLQGKITGIIDDGATRIGVESTVIDLSDPAADPMILRPGAVTKEQLEAVIGGNVTIDRHECKVQETPKSPGMKYKHYAPDTQVMMVRPERIGMRQSIGQKKRHYVLV